jgi:phosphoserine aminotransferase
MADTTHNFNAGPAALPQSVLEQVQRELLDYNGTGLSIMAHSHRADTFEAVLADAKARLARLYDLPDTHEVLFLQGGASLQFGQIPMNFGLDGAYVDTGVWSAKAIAEARTWAGAEAHRVKVLWSDAEGGYRRTPRPEDLPAAPAEAAYLHYTSNNTIYGTQFHALPSGPPVPAKGGTPLIVDASSDFLSRPARLDDHALMYAGAQKNAGPSGVTVLLIHKRYSRGFEGDPRVPAILRYVTQAKADSMYNTPNTFGIYVLGLTAAWAEAQGGLSALATLAATKANTLYAGVIDAFPGVFAGHAELRSRSHMNVTFTLRDASGEDRLFEALDRAHIVGVRGHRSVGGLRASIYNAVPQASVDRLAQVLTDFARTA